MHLHASHLWLGKVDNLGRVGEEVDAVLELGELSVELVKLVVLTLGGKVDNRLAELADIVVLGEELVRSASIGNGSDEGDKANVPHSKFDF